MASIGPHFASCRGCPRPAASCRNRSSSALRAAALEAPTGGGASGAGGGASSVGRRLGGGGGGGDGGRSSARLASRALLGAAALAVGAAACPQKAYAAGAGPLSIPGAGLATRLQGGVLSSSAPSASPPGSMSARMARASAAGEEDNASCESSLHRPHRKTLHVPCKGSTLVVPLSADGSRREAAAVGGLSRLSVPWQRGRVVETPLELSEREVRMLCCPQARVRDSVLV